MLRTSILLSIIAQSTGIATPSEKSLRHPQHDSLVQHTSAARSSREDPLKELPDNPFNKGKADRDQRVMDAITGFRAEVCAKMKEEHGKKFESYDECLKFMKGACKPGKDKAMDGDRKEITSGKGFCEEFFPLAKAKAEAKVAAEDAANAAKKAAAPPAAPAPAPAADSAKAPAAAKKRAAAAPAVQVEAAAGPAPGPAASPAGSPAGPAPAPFVPGKSEGKPPGKIAKDEKYYYKDDGKAKERLHMSEKQRLPTQGYWGKLIEHEDMETATSDWGEEFGGKTNSASFNEFCRKHPNNPWCESRHGFQHSQASTFFVSSALFSALMCQLVF